MPEPWGRLAFQNQAVRFPDERLGMAARANVTGLNLTDLRGKGTDLLDGLFTAGVGSEKGATGGGHLGDRVLGVGLVYGNQLGQVLGDEPLCRGLGVAFGTAGTVDPLGPGFIDRALR